MSGRQQKKINQKFRREFRGQARDEAKKLMHEQFEEERIKLAENIFKKRPGFVPMFLWQMFLGLVCTHTGKQVYELKERFHGSKHKLAEEAFKEKEA